MMNRRTTISAGLAAAFFPAMAFGQEDTSSVDLLTRMITEVIQAGDVSVIPELVSANISIPDFNISGIDGFTAASEAGHASRQESFTDYAFGIVAIFGDDEWAVAYVRMTGTTTDGVSEDVAVFYSVRIVDGLISEMYLA